MSETTVTSISKALGLNGVYEESNTPLHIAAINVSSTFNL